MGIFGFLKQMKNMKAAGGNFGFIAQNIATIYYVLGETSYGRRIDEEKKLYATGILDALAYINEGSLTTENITDSIILGSIGEVRLGFYSVKHRDSFNIEENERLIGFAMQLEAFIFEASSERIDYHDIVDQVVAKKSIIADTINHTLLEGKKSPLYSNVHFNVTDWLSDPNILHIIDDYSPII